MNVLILSDFSEVAINATHYAMDMFQNEQVNFTLANIYVPNPEATQDNLIEKRQATKARLQERVEKLRERSAGRPHKVTGHYSEDNLINATRSFLNLQKVDLIVMGAVSKKMRHSTILGDHTFEIMSKIKCTILAVPDGVQFTVLQNLLMPIDYSVSLHNKNFKFLYSEQFFRRTRLSVWEIGSAVDAHQRAIKQGILSDFKGIKVEFSTINDTESYDTELWTGVQKNFDLIVLHGKNLNICRRLMHDKHGLYTAVPNRLPLLVLHD